VSGVTDGNSANAGAITNSNDTQALLDDLKERGYKLTVGENGNLYTDPKGPPITPVIYWALQANYGKLVKLLSPPVTDSYVVPDTNVRKDNTDWSKVADLRPARGEELEQVMAEYKAAYAAADAAVKAAGPKDWIEGMMMHWREMNKQRSGRDAEAKRRIEASRKGGACGKCGRTLEDDEAVYTKCRTYAGIAGGLMSRPGPRFDNVTACQECAPKGMVDPEAHDEYTVGERTVRVRVGQPVMELPCATCERPVVEKLTNRRHYRFFCCYRCEYTYHNHRRSQRDEHLRQKVCEVCSKEFTATRAHTKTCSPACKQKAYRQRRRSQAPG
jgi:hypothetical protein